MPTLPVASGKRSSDQGHRGQIHPAFTLSLQRGTRAAVQHVCDGVRDTITRRAIVIGHDPSGTRPPVEVDLGFGLVRDAWAVGDELWVVVARRRFLAVPHDRGVDVVAVSQAGASRTVHSADTLDVSRSAPPLRRPPEEQIRDHVEQVRRTFDNLESFWRGAAGAMSPLSEGLSNAAVSVVGDWPTASVVVTLRYLMADLDTDYLAPADEAVGGVLDT